MAHRGAFEGPTRCTDLDALDGRVRGQPAARRADRPASGPSVALADRPKRRVCWTDRAGPWATPVASPPPSRSRPPFRRAPWPRVARSHRRASPLPIPISLPRRMTSSCCSRLPIAYPLLPRRVAPYPSLALSCHLGVSLAAPPFPPPHLPPSHVRGRPFFHIYSLDSACGLPSASRGFYDGRCSFRRPCR